MEKENRKERERKQREADIVMAARRIFLKKGFEDSSMDEIALEAEFTKPTLYQYFKDKESLYLAVALSALKEMQIAVQGGLEPQTGAWDTLKKACENLLSFCTANPELFRLVGALSQIRPKLDAQGSEERQNRLALASFNDGLFHDMAQLIAQAQREGSVAEDLDPTSASHSLLFILTGFLNQLSFTGKTFTQHFHLDWQEFSQNCLDLLLRSLLPSKKIPQEQ